MTASHVRLTDVILGFGGTTAVGGASLSVAHRDTVVILGPSGCGKATLLRLVAELVAPDGGSVTAGGAPPRPGPGIAIVFPSCRLLPWRTAKDNITFALLPAKARAAQYLALVGLSRFAQAYPATLSGGMRQRRALARALARKPGLLLMGEPSVSLDDQSRELMQVELLRLMADHPATALFVTRFVHEALRIGDRIPLMSPRPGRIAKKIAVPFARPRWGGALRADPAFAALRGHLWGRLRQMVLTETNFDFYGRDPDREDA